MGAFEYTALDAAGRSRKGVIEGDTPRHVRSLLRERQLLPLTVEQVAEQESKRQRGSHFGFGAGTHGLVWLRGRIRSSNSSNACGTCGPSWPCESSHTGISFKPAAAGVPARASIFANSAPGSIPMAI